MKSRPHNQAFQLDPPWSGTIESTPAGAAGDYHYHLDVYRHGGYGCPLFLEGQYPGREAAECAFKNWVMIWIGQYESKVKAKDAGRSNSWDRRSNS